MKMRPESDYRNPFKINDLQYSPKIMHAQELLFASARRQLLAASCGSLAFEFSKPQELLCGYKLQPQERLYERIYDTQELLCGRTFKTARTSLR